MSAAASSSSLKGNSNQQQPVAKERKRIGLPFQAKNALVLVGTYHSILAGLVLRGSKFALKFTTKHHVGCINSVAVCDKFIATSGTDERIFLYTCKNKGNSVSDLGSLAPPAEVRCLSFPTQQFLACGLSDGSLIVYKTRDWECAFVLHNVHAKAIEGIGFHPAAGKIAVTIGNDRFICVLDMNHGKVVTKMRVPIPIHCPRGVFFSASGKYFFIVLPFVVLVYDAMTAVLCHRLEQSEQQPSDEIHSAVVAGDDLVIIGCEDGTIRCVRIDEKAAAAAVEAVIAAQKPAQDAKRPSLASLDKSKQAAAKADTSDDSSDDDEDSEASSQHSDDDDDESGSDNEAEKGGDDKKKKKITFEKRPRHYTENATADMGNVKKLTKGEGPYLQTSSISTAKAKAQEEKTAADKARKAEHQQQYDSVPVVHFPIDCAFLDVPAELEASQAAAPKQCKRKYPTRHDGRVRTLIIQPDPSQQNVLISADTEGCVIAWKIDEKSSAAGANPNAVQLRHLASANTKSHVTAVTSLMQE